MRQNHVPCESAFRMASSSELNTVVFMEEIQKYDCLYNKFSEANKNKYKKIKQSSRLRRNLRHFVQRMIGRYLKNEKVSTFLSWKG